MRTASRPAVRLRSVSRWLSVAACHHCRSSRELEKPGRDPRPAFTTASFAGGVETLDDLAPGMILAGVATNVAAFGAFVNVGVHRDGLVQVSAMSRSFVPDPREVVRSGDVVRVKVLGVDAARRQISLMLRLDDEPGGQARAPGQTPARQHRKRADAPATGRRHGRRVAPRRPGQRPPFKVVKTRL